MKKMNKGFFLVLIICLVVALSLMTAFAHGGRTDSSGGHKDNKNKSGLGGYHYHCGGYPPHLHPNGVCPYKSGALSSSQNSSSSSSSVPKTVYSTRINVANVPTKIDAGETAKLEATVYPSNAEDNLILWESSDTSILTVNSMGFLKAVGVGTATITAKTLRGTTNTFTITVDEVMPERISIADNNHDILIHDTQILECDFVPKNTTDKSIEWKSSDESVISVSANGKITANEIGSAVISATHNELTDSINIEVKQVEAENVVIVLPNDVETKDDGQYKLKKGSQMHLETEIKPENTTYKDIEWGVSDEGLASIDKNGVLMAKATGNVVVTATAKSGVTDEIEIEIYSNTEKIAVCSVGLVAIGGGTVLYYKKKKRNHK